MGTTTQTLWDALPVATQSLQNTPDTPPGTTHMSACHTTLTAMILIAAVDSMHNDTSTLQSDLQPGLQPSIMTQTTDTAAFSDAGKLSGPLA